MREQLWFSVLSSNLDDLLCLKSQSFSGCLVAVSGATSRNLMDFCKSLPCWPLNLSVVDHRSMDVSSGRGFQVQCSSMSVIISRGRFVQMLQDEILYIIIW